MTVTVAAAMVAIDFRLFTGLYHRGARIKDCGTKAYETK